MFLSNKLSYCITSALLENSIIEKEEAELYKYCYNYFLEQFFYAVIVLFLGVLLHCFETTLLFILFCIMHLCLYYGTMSLCAIVVAISMFLGFLFQKGSKNDTTNSNM